jgi:hypothetical protein
MGTFLQHLRLDDRHESGLLIEGHISGQSVGIAGGRGASAADCRMVSS